MQIVIDIPDYDYRQIKEYYEKNDIVEATYSYIYHGTPLDEIKAEIIEKFENCDICEWLEDYDYEENDISEYQSVGDISDIIAIIDKYRKEE